MEHPPKRIKIEEESAVSFWNWYLPNSAHPKKASSEMSKTFFRFDSAYRVYCTLVKRKWHNRWYMIEVLKVFPHIMWTFEVLRSKGAFTAPRALPTYVVEFWEQ